jgi:hypothetical protein
LPTAELTEFVSSKKNSPNFSVSRKNKTAPAATDAAQAKMDNGIGIEESAKRTQQRGPKVAVFPARA